MNTFDLIARYNVFDSVYCKTGCFIIVGNLGLYDDDNCGGEPCICFADNLHIYGNVFIDIMNTDGTFGSSNSSSQSCYGDG